MQSVIRWSARVALLGMALGLSVGAGAQAPAAGKAAVATQPGVEAKLDETLDTTYTKAGDKISATLQAEAMVNGTTLPKGTKLTGSVLKSVKQDKEHKNPGMVLLLDTAVLKNGTTVPVHAAIVHLRASHSDEVEQVDVGSGDVTDATYHADKVMGAMDDANGTTKADRTTSVGGVKVTSSIKGLILFASPNGSSSGIVVAEKGPLILEKWTRLNVVLSAK